MDQQCVSDHWSILSIDSANETARLADRECMATTVCAVDDVETHPATLTSDRTCTPTITVEVFFTPGLDEIANLDAVVFGETLRTTLESAGVDAANILALEVVVPSVKLAVAATNTALKLQLLHLMYVDTSLTVTYESQQLRLSPQP